jgi:hypothetical protein
MAKGYCDEVFRAGSGVSGGVGGTTVNSESNSDVGGAPTLRSESKEDGSDGYVLSGKFEDRDVYLMLLRTCLQQPASVQRLPGWAGGRNSALVEPALKILKRHSEHIDPVQALSLLPPSTSVADLHSYLEGVLRETTTRRRNNQVCKNLLKLELLQAMKVIFPLFFFFSFFGGCGCGCRYFSLYGLFCFSWTNIFFFFFLPSRRNTLFSKANMLSLTRTWCVAFVVVLFQNSIHPLFIPT